MPNNDLSTARAELAVKLTAALTEALSPSAGPAPLILVDAAGGLGKSHFTAQLLRLRRVTWFGERNKMLADVKDFLNTPISGLVPLPASATATTTGVPSIEKRPSREDKGFCSQFDKRIKPLQMFGLGRFEQRMGCRLCPDVNTCRYQNWRPSTPWLFSSHARLGLRNDDKYLFEGREIVVIDESPVKEILRATTLEVYEIERLLFCLKEFKPTALSELAAEAFRRLFEVILDLLGDPPPARRRVELRVLLEELGYGFIDNLPATEEQVRSAANLVTRQRQGERGTESAKDAAARIRPIDPMSTAYLIQELQFIGAEGLGAKLHRLADALAADTGARPTCVLVLPSEQGRGGILAGQRVTPPIPAHLPLVILDATSDEWIYQFLFPERSRIHVRVEVQQTAEIVQTTDHRYPAGTLGDPKSPSINRLMDIVDKYKVENPHHKIAVVVQKRLFNRQKHVKNRILESVAETDVVFFWSNRGENTLKDYDALFVLGAPELPSFEIEARARAFMSTEVPAHWEKPYDYQVVPPPDRVSGEGYIHDEDGSVLIERGYQQGGPSSVYYAFHQAEYAQAMLRLRPYDPSKPKRIYFFSNVYVPYLHMRRVKENDLLGRAPDLLVRSRDLLRNLRAGGHNDVVSQKELAGILGVSKVAVTKAKKMYGHTSLWKEIESLLNPNTPGLTARGSAPSTTTS